MIAFFPIFFLFGDLTAAFFLVVLFVVTLTFAFLVILFLIIGFVALPFLVTVGTGEGIGTVGTGEGIGAGLGLNISSAR